MGKHGGAESLGALTSEIEAGDTHAILHVGDFAYDFDSDGGVVSSVLEFLLTHWHVLHVCVYSETTFNMDTPHKAHSI